VTQAEQNKNKANLVATSDWKLLPPDVAYFAAHDELSKGFQQTNPKYPYGFEPIPN